MIANHRQPGRARLGPVLVSVVIVLICAGVLIPGINRIRQMVQRTDCTMNVYLLNLALNQYESAKGHFPQAAVSNPNLPLESRLSWLVVLAPYMENDNPNSKIENALAWDDPKNREYTHQGYRLYQCPSNQSVIAHSTSYLGISGVGADAATYPLDHPDAGIFGYDRTLKRSDLSDTFETLMILETYTGGPWAKGGYSTVRGIETTTAFGTTMPFGSTHRSGGLFTSIMGATAGTVGGSARFIHYGVDPNILKSLARIRGEKNAVLE